jgi:curved DNA-binding protein CbpA
MAGQDYYADLKLTRYATTSQIKSAFHALAKQCHPDKSGSDDTAAFRRIHEAYETLSNPETRAAYDRKYPLARVYYQADDDEDMTRTAAYEEEEAEREYEAHQKPQEFPRRRSPPPFKPVRKPNETGWSYFFGKPYKAWEKRDAAYRKRHPEYDAENQP